MISIILPVYNASTTIARALESILAQSYSGFEVLAVDDGSTDGSDTILDMFARKDSRIKVFHKPNGGANSARNLGLENIQGEYVTFCDADDYVDSDWLQAFTDNLGENDVVIQGWKYVRDNNVELIYYDSSSSDPAHAADLMSGMESFGILVTKCFCSDIIRNNHLRFNENFRFLEDEEFVCRYWTQVNKCQFVHVAAYNYFVPNFDMKYKAIDNYALYVSLVENASQFIHHTDSVTMQKYTMGLFRNMMLSFEQGFYVEAGKRLHAFADSGGRFRTYNKYMKCIRKWNWMLWWVILFVYALKRTT